MPELAEIYRSIVLIQRDIGSALSAGLHQLTQTGVLPPSLIVLALALGAVHALTPGHGKSIILSYFLGHSARAIDGLIMAGRVVFSHSFTAVLLVLLVGSAASKWGRPSGAAEILQLASYALITVLGLFYLYKATKPKPQDPNSRPHALPYAVGVLPCPLTMLIVGNAIAAGSVLGAIGLAAVVAIGSAATISLFGASGILLRKAFMVATEGHAPVAAGLLRAAEVISSAAIFLIGLLFLLDGIRTQ